MTPSRIAFSLCLLALAASAGAQQAARKSYIVELADTPAAGYSGTISGLRATRPAAGTRFNPSAADVQLYMSYLDGRRAAVQASVPAAQVFQKYGVVFNGFAARLTDAELLKLASNPGVRAITVDEARPINTNYTPTFLGINGPGGAWSMLDASGRAVRGEGVVIAHVDTGVWPENPSVSDKVDALGKPIASHLPGTVVYDPLPAGRYRGICQAGEGFSAAKCNNKLVGAQYFNAGWIASGIDTWPLEYLNSPRDEDGHGTHTLTTAGGNQNTDVVVAGNPVAGISGIAPRARLAAYKVCFTDRVNKVSRGSGSCFPSDSVAAIDKAVADGVDVINFSVSGSQTTFRDAVEVAFFYAAEAGVFVAASAGNSGPGNTVAHLSPWLTTVGNSTHDRFTVASVTLGNGVTASGPSFQGAGLAATALVNASAAGLPSATGANLARCFGAADGLPAQLDPAKVAGKIVVCERGGNFLVNKSANALEAGAAGMILQNTPTSANTTLVIAHSVPTVHLSNASYAAVTGYAATAGATAAFGPGVQVAGVVAPVMADTSSRGPNRADANVLKPDITAPGTDIIAGYSNHSVDAAQRAQIIAGTLIPGPGANMISGTSMSSPHVAGAAALLKQANPGWSPYAIKSALMTSARQSVKLANGAVDADRWGFGAGHLDPTAALATSLVYDSTARDHRDYYNGAINPWNLNLASLTRAAVVGVGSLTRTLTNKGSNTVTYTAAASLAGFDVTVVPASLTLAGGASASYTTTLARASVPLETWVFGDVTWSGDGKQVRSPLSAKAVSLAVLGEVTDTRAAGTKVFTVGTGYDGSLLSAAVGLVPATRNSGRVSTGDRVCYDFTVPAGAKIARVQLLNSETEGGSASDLDLAVYRGATPVAQSGGGTSDELISLSNPAAGAYSACVEGYAPINGSASFTLSSWVVGPAVGTQSLRAFGASRVVVAGTASVGIAWNVAAGARYLGVVEFRNSAAAAPIGSTTVLIDTALPVLATATAPVLRDKIPR